MAAGPLALTGPALAAVAPARGGRLLLGVTRVPRGGQRVGSLCCHSSGWAGRGRGSSDPPGVPLPLPPSGPLSASPAQPAASRLPATSRGPVHLHLCPSTAIMARPQPLLPACPLPAHPTAAAAACSVDRSPPLHRRPWGRAAPFLVPEVQPPPAQAGTPLTQTLLCGAALGPLVFCPRAGL